MIIEEKKQWEVCLPSVPGDLPLEGGAVAAVFLFCSQSGFLTRLMRNENSNRW